jgi:hypothetical protein
VDVRRLLLLCHHEHLVSGPPSPSTQQPQIRKT